VNIPRAPAHVIAQFETLVNAKMLAWAAARNVETIDLHSAIGGRDELFGDLIHFNDNGADAVSALIANYLAQSRVADRRQASTVMQADAVQ
jgi:hypothetical protein